jgi:phospholipid transport system substrate-binding protein
MSKAPGWRVTTMRAMWRLSYGVFCAVVLALGFAASSPSAQAAAANPAEAYVQQNIDRGYTILNNASLGDTQRRTQFRDFMLSLTDTKRIGMFTLGQYANSASKNDVDAFTNAFADYAVAVYESRLSKYKGQTLKVTGSTSRATDDTVVNADVVDPNAANAQPIKVGFRVRKTSDGRPIVTDINVEGVWLALSQRSDFTAFLQMNGGSVAALTDHLKMQTVQLRADVPTAGGRKS